MLQILPILSDSLVAVINMAVGNVSPNLSSKNKEIYQSAMDIMDAFMENIGKYLFLERIQRGWGVGSGPQLDFP